MRSSVSLALLSAAGLASARTFDINVGQGGQVFTPDTVTGAVAGDVINFHFFPANHSVVQGAFGTGCQPAQGGFFSGFMPVPAGQQGVCLLSLALSLIAHRQPRAH